MIDVHQMTRTRREAAATPIGLPGILFAPLTPPAPLTPLGKVCKV